MLSFPAKPHRGIRIDRIPVAGSGGLIFAVGIILIGLIGLPETRTLALIGLAGGIPLAGWLYFWHNQTRW